MIPKRFSPILLVVALLTWPLSLPARGGPTPARSQDRSRQVERALYRLNFALHILENNERETRKYTFVLEEREEGKVRALTKVPISVEEGRVRYIETGVRFDAEYREQDGKVILEIEMHFTDLLPPAEGALLSQPRIQEWQSELETTLLPGVPAVVSSFEDAQGGRRYELEVTAEKLE